MRAELNLKQFFFNLSLGRRYLKIKNEKKKPDNKYVFVL